MDPRISFVTLAVRDLDATRRFYVDGLGWTPELDVAGEVVMIRVGEHQILSLWDEAHFEAEVGRIGRGDGVPPFTLAHNLATREEVDARAARRSGRPAQTSARPSSATGAGTPATSPTPTASAGRSPTTPTRSGAGGPLSPALAR